MRLLPALLASVFSYTLLAMPVSTTAQDITDTLFYDIKWQLCERTPAYYYRIGTMRIDSIARYVGPATDYYMNGQPEMKTTYNANGELDGETTFYYPDGNTRLKGRFTMGQMTGKWFWYSSGGMLRAILDCKSETDFTPLFLRSKKGKVMLEDGNGKFWLETKDFDDLLFPPGYEIEGSVRNGLKDGTWKYVANITPFANLRISTRQTFLSEQYVRGRFVRALSDPYGNSDRKRILDKPFTKITLYRPKLLTLDMLKSDIVFARKPDGTYQLKPFLLARRAPFIEEALVSADQNFALFIRVICTALMKKEELAFKGSSLPGKTFGGASYPMIRLTQVDKKDKYNANIRFTILPDRSIDNLVIEGKIDDRSRELITYYLQKLRGLYVDPEPELNKMVLLLQTGSTSETNYLPAIQLSRSYNW